MTRVFDGSWIDDFVSDVTSRAQIEGDSREQERLDNPDDLKGKKKRGKPPLSPSSKPGSRKKKRDSDKIWSEVISWSPRVIHLHNVVYPEEREHLIKIGETEMERSTVVGNKGESVTSDIRTSKGTECTFVINWMK